MKKFILLLVILMGLSLTECEKDILIENDSAMNHQYLLKRALDLNDYETFNDLFTDSRRDVISKKELEQFSNIYSSSGASFILYETITFSNGEMILVRMAQDNLTDEYKVEDIINIPDEMTRFFNK